MAGMEYKQMGETSGINGEEHKKKNNQTPLE